MEPNFDILKDPEVRNGLSDLIEQHITPSATTESIFRVAQAVTCAQKCAIQFPHNQALFDQCVADCDDLFAPAEQIESDDEIAFKTFRKDARDLIRTAVDLKIPE